MRLAWRGAAALFISGALASAVTAKGLPLAIDPPAQSARAAVAAGKEASTAADSNYKLVKLKVVAIDIPQGEITAENSVHTLYGCNVHAPVTTSPGGRRQLPNVANEAAWFDDELRKANMTPVAPDKDSLFAQNQTQIVEFSVGGIVTKLHSKMCTRGLDARGDTEMSISWQVFSNVEQKVVFRLDTAATESHEDWVPRRTFSENDLFRVNVRQLLAAPEFRRLLTGTPMPADASIAPPTKHATVAMALLPPSATRSLAQVRAATVTVLAGPSTGSGVLVSADGFIVTAAHAVGDLPQVRLRWSDGVTTVGTVVARSTSRDVALIRTAAHAPALALQPAPPGAGTTVYAVGSPLGDRFQGTITKGIVSGSPLIGGYRFIQSDVAINPGNSGGPLIDEAGHVVGIAVVKVAGVQVSNFNLFVPVSEVIAYLGITGK